MLWNYLPLRHIRRIFCASPDALAEDVQAAAIGLGWFALVVLLSHGGTFLMTIFGSMPADLDLPPPDPAYDQMMMTDSLMALGGCALAIVGAELWLRRRGGPREADQERRGFLIVLALAVAVIALNLALPLLAIVHPVASMAAEGRSAGYR